MDVSSLPDHSMVIARRPQADEAISAVERMRKRDEIASLRLQ
jgi:hypothetical protein